MTQISLTHALALYSVLLGVVIAAIWLYTEFTVHRYRGFLEKQYLWRCVYCGYTYLDEAAERVSQCPRCESFNATEDRHARFVRDKLPPQPSRDKAGQADAGRRNPSRRKRPHQRRRGPRKR